MKKQVLKALSLASLIFALTGPTVSANIGEPLNVKIPFAFTAGNKTLPAGAYRVRNLTSETLLIQSADSKQVTTILTNHKQAGPTPGQAKLAFHRYGDRYFLAQVWTPWEGYEVTRSRAERELTRNPARHLADRKSVVKGKRQDVGGRRIS